MGVAFFHRGSHSNHLKIKIVDTNHDGTWEHVCEGMNLLPPKSPIPRCDAASTKLLLTRIMKLKGHPHVMVFINPRWGQLAKEK